jgi:hypothetical protein
MEKMQRDVSIYATIIELENTRKRIVAQLERVERALSSTIKSSPRCVELLEEKNALLVQLREEKRRLGEAKRVRNQTPPEHVVTDHALVRWMERKCKVDVQALKDRMMSDGLRAALASKQEYWCDGELVFVLQRGVVLTVYPGNLDHRPTEKAA